MIPSSSRRRIHKIAVVTAVLCGLSAWTGAAAQSFPSKPIRWIVVAPAGSSLDAIARSMQDKLKDTLGQPIVIENRPQAGGTLGAGEVAKSAPDGHTWLLGFNGPVSFAPFLYSKLSYDPAKDLAPVVVTTSQPNLIAVNSSLPVSNVAELIELMRKNPG